MIKKTKVLIAMGGTGGHVLPGYNLAKHLYSNNFEVELVTDKRGFKYLKSKNKLNVSILPSSPLVKKNIITLIFSLIKIFFSLIKSIILLFLKKPSIIFGMGGYASFPICIAAKILKIKFIIYENNLIIGKTNKILLPYAKKIFVSHKELEGMPIEFSDKVSEIGNIIDKKIINFSNIQIKKNNSKKISIIVLGGSQAAKIFAEKLPEVFKRCSQNGISLKIYQHWLASQDEKLQSFYEKANIEFETFYFSNNLIEYFSKVDLAITRSGSSVLAELTNANIPIIAVPLPTSADDHQLKNAIYYQKKKFAFIVEEKDLNDRLFNLINDLNKNRSILNQVENNQRQYSDKNVYQNIDAVIKEIINEKN